MKTKSLPSVERLIELFDYNPETGELFRKFKTHTKKVHSVMDTGYLRVKIDGVYYRVHRVVWKMFHGEDPREGLVIDHINQIKTDNRIENLREASQSLNVGNAKKPYKNPETGESIRMTGEEAKKLGWRSFNPGSPPPNQCRPVIVTYTSGKARTYPSVKSALLALGVCYMTLSRWAKGIQKPRRNRGIVSVSYVG